MISTLWFVFLVASFTVTVLTLTRIQMRVARRLGWTAVGRDLVRHYWTDLSPVERMLVWCGLVVFLLTIMVAILWTFVRSAA